MDCKCKTGGVMTPWELSMHKGICELGVPPSQQDTPYKDRKHLTKEDKEWELRLEIIEYMIPMVCNLSGNKLEKFSTKKLKTKAVVKFLKEVASAMPK